MENKNKNMPQRYSDQEDEIDFVELAKTLWKGRKEVVRTTLIFIGIGLISRVLSK